jgi:hypothetical protein
MLMGRVPLTVANLVVGSLHRARALSTALAHKAPGASRWERRQSLDETQALSRNKQADLHPPSPQAQ